MARQVKSGTLVGSAKSTVTLTVKWRYLEVYNRGAADIWATTTGDDPTVAGDDCFVIPAGTRVRIPNAQATRKAEIELISSSTPAYTVSGWDNPLV